jgi:hypothetical protein
MKGTSMIGDSMPHEADNGRWELFLGAIESIFYDSNILVAREKLEEILPNWLKSQNQTLSKIERICIAQELLGK